MQLQIKNSSLPLGVVGEYATSDPRRTRGFYLSSSNGKDDLNIVGNVVFHSNKDDRIVGHFETADTGAVAGILGFPKVAVRKDLIPCCGTGVLNDGKNATESNPIINNQMIEVIQQGYVFVKIWNMTSTATDNFSTNIGDLVYYNTESGKLTAITPTGQIKQGQKFKRLQGATIAINHIAKPAADNTYSIGIIYIDLAGDAIEKIANA